MQREEERKEYKYEKTERRRMGVRSFPRGFPVRKTLLGRR